MNTLKTTLGGAMALALSAGAMASDFNVEIGGSYVDFDFTKGYGADATVFFQPVSIQQGPFAEAPFINRASNLGAAYLRQKDGDFDVYTLGGEFYIDDLYIAANYSRFSNGFSLNDYGVRLGYMVADNTRVTVGYNRQELPFGFDIDRYTVGAKHLMLLTADTALSLEADIGIADADKNRFTYDLAADYYLTRSFSLGARYSGIGSDDQWGVGTRFFFTPRFSAGAEYTRDSGDDIFALRLAARF
ncbi:MAG: putative porin [Wenzhouxiangella sp.]